MLPDSPNLQYAVDLFTKSAELGWVDYGMGTEAYAKWIAGVPKFSAEHGNWGMPWSGANAGGGCVFRGNRGKIPSDCRGMRPIDNAIPHYFRGALQGW